MLFDKEESEKDVLRLASRNASRKTKLSIRADSDTVIKPFDEDFFSKE